MKDSNDQLAEDLALPFKGLRAGWRNPQKARLRSELEHLQAMLNERKHSMSSKPRPEMVKEHEQATSEQHENRPGPYDPAINLRSAKEYLEHANRHLRRDTYSAWQHAIFALEQLARAYPDDQLIVWAQTLRAELCEAGRFTYWRKVAIENLLKDLPRARGEILPPCQREAYFEALRLRNQELMNQYWRLDMVRHHQLLLAAIGVPVLIATVIILVQYASDLTGTRIEPTSPDGAQNGWQGGPVPCLLAILFGIVGAVVSAAQRSTTTPPHRIPEILGSDIASFSRIPIGAVAGLTVWLFSVASVQSAATLDVPNLFLAAFGAGFAERLIVQGSGSPVLGSDQSEGAGPLAHRPTTLDDETLRNHQPRQPSTASTTHRGEVANESG